MLFDVRGLLPNLLYYHYFGGSGVKFVIVIWGEGVRNNVTKIEEAG